MGRLVLVTCWLDARFSVSGWVFEIVTESMIVIVLMLVIGGYGVCGFKLMAWGLFKNDNECSTFCNG